MILDMFDAIFMARRGVLRAQRTLVMRSLHLCCYYRAATDQHRVGERPTERVPPRRPQEHSPLMGPLHPFHDSQDKSRHDGCEQTTDAGTRESERYK